MEKLPVELVRLIFGCCDLEDAAILRLVTPTLAQVGYDFIVPPNFRVVPWRDDAERLERLSHCPQLRPGIDAITFNFSEIRDETLACSSSSRQLHQRDFQESIRAPMPLPEGCSQYATVTKRGKVTNGFESQGQVLYEIFERLPNLRGVKVTYTESPFKDEAMTQFFAQPDARKMDHNQACKNLNTIIYAMRDSRVTSLTMDRFPLELFRASYDRKHWFACSSVFERLQKLNLVMDFSILNFPQSKFKAVNGLGYLLRLANNLTHLSLGFHHYTQPQQKFMLCFQDMLDIHTFPKLTDLKLEGVSCASDDLGRFLVRHRATLERLRFGGRGLCRPDEPSLGGVDLWRGSFRVFLTNLRQYMKKLKNVHFEGACRFDNSGLPGDYREFHVFRAVYDDDWKPVSPDPKHLSSTSDGKRWEDFVLRGAPYPTDLQDDQH